MRRVRLYLFILVVSTTLQKANATTYTWTGLAFNGNWTSSGNWFPSSGYPGSSGTTDIAVINTSLQTVTLTSSLTISQLQSTLYGVAGVTVQLTGSNVLTINSGISTAQPILAAIGLTFSGSGKVNIGGTSQLGYQSSMAIASGATVNFTAGSAFNFPNNHSSINNAGALNFLTGSTLTLQDFSQLINTGTLTTIKSTITLSGSGTPANIIDNQGTFIDHASTINVTGQNSAIKNSTSAAVTKMHGTTLTFSSSNNGMSLSNAGWFTADSAATINVGTQNCPITNTGTFYSGISNSACIVNLTGQGANINNSGTFYVGSTSGVTISGYQAAITNNSTGFFIIQSDSYGSGYIGSIPSTSVGYITGAYYVQRYITGGSSTYRGYRMVSSPVYTSTASGNNIYSLNYVGSTSLLTGSGGTSGGFDKAGNPTLYLYRENMPPSNTAYTSGNFRALSAINASPSYSIYGDAGTFNIPVGNGFLFFFRGDRTSNFANKYTPGTSAESVVMTAIGSMTQGQVTVKDWFTPSSSTLSYTAASPTSVRGFNLVGNPYPSAIDWESFQTASTTTGIYGSNVGSTMYELNPTNQNFGAYVKGGGGVGTNKASNIIPSGQAFLVVATSTSAQLIFNETAKSTAQVTGLNLLMGTGATEVASNPYLRMELNKGAFDMDDMLIRFNSGSLTKYSAAEDAPYQQGFGKGHLSSMSSDSISLAINTLPLPKASESIPLNITATIDTVYQLELKELKQVPQLYDVWLMDAYMKDSVNMRDNPKYNFSIINKDSASYGSKRFTLVVRQNPYYAYQLLSFDAKKAADAAQILVSWATRNEQNYTHFTVERSLDRGKTFEVIGNVSSAGLGAYSFIDNAPAIGPNFYRLRQEDINDSVRYSKTAEVMYSKAATGIAGNLSVYPNPAKSTVTLVIDTKVADMANYSISITNSSGLIVKQVNSTQSCWQGDVTTLLPGTYTISVINNQDKSKAGVTRFVKL
ncbi:T9SS type A sorting domain-containing protein [Mucilaginibacter sp.]|jgi:hypothetical protein|uniref:T9SS type A sorting domain-containing protein n=1 Tax=Mucilaginibacter sp. TaxID=1882438 RepID=UPI002B8697D8|nr:T9SS type A sorting domain-containing protein [Mucilaginibacter sp.]HTI59827.1 T9SS type A sorting domain-containing protein [Mucilaginibacter sp.]